MICHVSSCSPYRRGMFYQRPRHGTHVFFPSCPDLFRASPSTVSVRPSGRMDARNKSGMTEGGDRAAGVEAVMGSRQRPRVFDHPFRHSAVSPGRGFGYSARFRRLSVIGTGSSFQSGSRPPPGLRRVPVSRVIARVCARGRGRAYRGGAARHLIARARRRTHLARPFPPGSFSQPPADRFLQKSRKAAPEAASLYFHSTPYRQMSSPTGNKK